MKKIFQTIAVIIIFGLAVAYAHHPAADIVDEDIYAIIDEMVSDTPHADLTFDDMGGDTGTMVTTIDTRSVSELEALVDDGLLTETSLLSGDVSIEIDFVEGGGVETTITQVR